MVTPEGQFSVYCIIKYDVIKQLFY